MEKEFVHDGERNPQAEQNLDRVPCLEKEEGK